MLNKTLNISTSPHITKGVSTDMIMRNVVYALIPVAIFAAYSFGINALLVIITSVVACVVTEHVLCRLSKKESTISDWSAVITGLLLGLTLPPIFPLWMAFFGGMIAIALGKFVFGGLGYNVFNPALVGRAVLQAAFPVAITTWSPAFLEDRFSHIASSVLAFPFAEPVVDGITSATPLSAWKFDHIVAEASDLALGLVSGSTGETSALLILLGGIYLIARNMMNWRIPVAILGSVFVLSGILYLVNSEAYPNPVFMLFSGGLMLGAVFMATDMVTSPMSAKGQLIFGAGAGILTILIRVFGAYPEGVSFAILIMNAFVPLLDRGFKAKRFGEVVKA